MVPCPVVGMSILSQGCSVAGFLIEHRISIDLLDLFGLKNANHWAFWAKRQGTSRSRRSHRGFGFAVAEPGEVDPVTTEVRAGDFVYGL